MHVCATARSTAASIRVGNHLGANDGPAARLTAHVAIIVDALYGARQHATHQLTIAGLVIVAVIFASRRQLAQLLSSDPEGLCGVSVPPLTAAVIELVASLLRIICFTQIFDGLNAVYSGIYRGCGRQNTGALLNFVGFELVGLPLAIALAFWRHLGVHGLWLGLLAGLVTQVSLFALNTLRLQWDEEAARAVQRCDVPDDIDAKSEATKLVALDSEGRALGDDLEPQTSTTRSMREMG